jgi:hypothetical protein
MKLCPDCGRHHRGVHCVHQTSPRSRSAILGSLLGLGALGVGCSSSQNPEVTDSTVASESAPNDDSAIADPSTSVDPAQVLARPTEPIIPEGTVMVPVYGIPPMPEPVPPVEVIDEEGSGESDETGDGSGLLPVEVSGLNP